MFIYALKVGCHMLTKVANTLNYISNLREPIPLGARRVFRVSTCVSLSLVIAYCIAMPLPFLAPVFALMFTLKPGSPLNIKALVALVLLIVFTTGIGLLLIPMLYHYAIPTLAIVAMGLYFSNYLTLNAGKALAGTFLIVGFTLISAAGTLSFVVATTVIEGLAISVAIAVFCQWAIYPFFPEDEINTETPEKKSPSQKSKSNWLALRSTIIIMPTYILLLTNPAVYLPIIMKAVSLGQQGSSVEAKSAGRELLGSTFLAGLFAIGFWFLLDLVTTLWMYASCMFIFSVYFVAKIYGVISSKWPPSFWQNTAVTMIILLGPAVEDSANGKDVYKAFAIRLGLFIVVTLYAVLAVYVLEYLKDRKETKYYQSS